MLKVVAEKAASEEPAFGIDEICREGARRMLAVALEAEVDATLRASGGSATILVTGSSCATAAPRPAP